MTTLQCSATNCTHNENNQCCLNSIKIEGNNATVPTDTSCNSFSKKGSFASNFMPQGSPDAETYVACDATNCNYNRGKVCQAEHVSVDAMGTSPRGNTECATYTPPKY